jgi:hypothetical protein
MEEVDVSSNQAILSWKENANVICQEIASELIKLKGHSKSKSLFVSNAHHFLERLIHLHCSEIKRLLMVKAKQF